MSRFWKRETKVCGSFELSATGIVVPLAEIENIEEEQEMLLKESWDGGIKVFQDTQEEYICIQSRHWQITARGPSWPTACLCKSSVTVTQPCSLMYMLSVLHLHHKVRVQ